MGQQQSSEEENVLGDLGSRCSGLISRIDEMYTEDFETRVRLSSYRRELKKMSENIMDLHLRIMNGDPDPENTQEFIDEYNKIFDSCEEALNKFQVELR